MELWNEWLGVLAQLLEMLAVDFGFGTGAAIITLTLLLRLALLPISWRCTWSATVHQRRLQRLQPELTEVRQRYRNDAAQLAQETLDVYRRHDLAMLNTRPILGTLVQLPVVLGMFQMLRQGLQQARFLWIASLSRPDLWIAAIAAATTAAMVAANPELPEQTRTLMIWLPALVAFVFALKFAAALGLYWTVSNCFAAAQTSAVHYLVNHRVRSGKLRI